MSTHKRIDAICIVIFAFTLALTALFMNGEALGITPIVNGDADGDMFTANDLDGSWDISSATQITLSDQGSRYSGGQQRVPARHCV